MSTISSSTTTMLEATIPLIASSSPIRLPSLPITATTSKTSSSLSLVNLDDRIKTLSSKIQESDSSSESDLDTKIGIKRRATKTDSLDSKVNTLSKTGFRISKELTGIKVTSQEGLGLKHRASAEAIDSINPKVTTSSKTGSRISKEIAGIITSSHEGLGLKRHRSTYNRIGVKKDTFSKESARFLSFKSELGKKRRADKTTLDRKNVKRNTSYKELSKEDLEIKFTLQKVDKLLAAISLEDVMTKKFTL